MKKKIFFFLIKVYTKILQISFDKNVFVASYIYIYIYICEHAKYKNKKVFEQLNITEREKKLQNTTENENKN
jgi:amino acid permease